MPTAHKGFPRVMHGQARSFQSAVLASASRRAPGHHPGHPTTMRVAAQQAGTARWDS